MAITERLPDRRTVLGLAAGAGAAGLLAAAGLLRRSLPGGWMATRVTAPDAARVSAFDRDGRMRFDRNLPARGHGLAVSPDGAVAVVVGRRPGHYAQVLSPGDGRVLATLSPGKGCVFCGHGLFTADGARFLATETDWVGERGLIAVYETATWRRLGAWESGGLDPHDLVLSADGRRLVVANGGLLTDPDAPGAVLNLDRMVSSLAVVDLSDGALLIRAVLPPDLHLLSIRHLVRTRDGAVAFAMQYQGPPEDQVPMVGLMDRDGALRLLELPAGDLRDLRHYCGSIATDPSGGLVAAASPRGGMVALWQAEHGRYLGRYDLPDVCGLAPGLGANRVLAASGQGPLAMVGPGTAARAFGALPSDAHWDNHMVAL